MNEEDKRATVKICVCDKCAARGSEDIYRNLKEGLPAEEAVVTRVDRCLGFCKLGPNIAINDNIVKSVKPFSAIETVRQELRDPSCKADGLGNKSLEELDRVLDDIASL